MKLSIQIRQSYFDLPVVGLLRLLQFFSILALLAFSSIGFYELWRAFREFDWATERPAAVEEKVSLNAKSDHTDGMPEKSLEKGAQAQETGNPKAGAMPPTPHKDVPIHAAFRGLEYLLMAPLFFLLLRSLDQYVEDLSEKQERLDRMKHVRQERKNIANWKIYSDEDEKKKQEHLDKLTRSEAAMRQIEDDTGMDEEVGRETLLETKALSIGLLFTIVATHLVGRLLSGEFAGAIGADGTYRTSDFIRVTVEASVGMVLLMILGGSYFAIEHVALKLRRAALEKPSRPKRSAVSEEAIRHEEGRNS